MAETNNATTGVEKLTSNLSSLNSFKSSTYGDMDKMYGKHLYGISRKSSDLREPPKDQVGYTFFTRPMLNLSLANIRNDRLLYQYAIGDESSVETYIRIMMDRLVAHKESISHKFADNNSAFIPILSNNLLTVTGFPDVIVDSYTSPSGSRKQQYNLLDGTDEINQSIDLNITFKNTYEDSIVSILNLWIRYMVKIKENILAPYPGFIGRRIVDYHSRIFRLVVSEDRRHVKRIAATGPLYPDVNSIGKYFDVTNSGSYNKEVETHSIKVLCMGIEYNDPILMKEFNDTVGFFNPAMRKVNEGAKPESVGLIKLSPEGELAIENNGYPRINMYNDNELEWYVKIK